MYRITVITLALILINIFAYAQIERPVKWSYLVKKNSEIEATIYIKASIKDGWHIYSQSLKDGGPVKTTFVFIPSKDYTTYGKTVEPAAISKYEPTFKMNVTYYEKTVTFIQKIKIKNKSTMVKAKVEFMACNDKQCLPPEEVELSIPVKL